MPGRRRVLGVQLVAVDRRFLVHVHDHDVAVGAEPDRTLLRIHLPDPRRVFARDLDVVVERHPALVHLREHDRNRRFDAAESGNAFPDRRLGHLAIPVAALLLKGVRRMIGRDHVDGAVQQALPQRFGMLPRAHRRIHLQQRADLRHLVAFAQQVVRACLRGHPQAPRLGILDHLRRLLGAGVHDMQHGAEVLGQEDQVRHRLGFAQLGT